MPLKLRIAATSSERDAVFKLRHQVFVVEEKRFEMHSDRILDRFDSFPETVLLLATDEEIPIGTVRLTLNSPAGMPALDLYDFEPFISTLSGKIASVGWLCVAESHRRRRGLVMALFKMIVNLIRKMGARHIIAPLNPGVLPLLQTIGATKIADEVMARELGVPIVPIHVDTDGFPSGIRETMTDPSDVIFDDSLERRIYVNNEPVVSKGEIGTEAFLIMRGSVQIIPENTEITPETGFLLGPGQVFGELSLLDGGPRTATVIAHSKEVDLMVWGRSDFIKQLTCDRNVAFRICQILGTRMRYQIAGNQHCPPHESLIARIILGASENGNKNVNIKWLAQQCGMWFKELIEFFEPWKNSKVIDISPTFELTVIDLQSLKSQIKTL
ncbi:MAG: cyclic nucleotide-binding domain-containing protein [Candidatus Riflebacteria bacterium]|nr:cyclic nucleotide-binding domain-containing protein [Candidatus Riflebacteria bacterium]